MRDVLPAVLKSLFHDFGVRRIERWLAVENIASSAKTADRIIANRDLPDLPAASCAVMNADSYAASSKHYYTVPSHGSVHSALNERWKTKSSLWRD